MGSKLILNLNSAKKISQRWQDLSCAVKDGFGQAGRRQEIIMREKNGMRRSPEAKKKKKRQEFPWGEDKQTALTEVKFLCQEMV